jgi:hypothetical protein
VSLSIGAALSAEHKLLTGALIFQSSILKVMASDENDEWSLLGRRSVFVKTKNKCVRQRRKILSDALSDTSSEVMFLETMFWQVTNNWNQCNSKCQLETSS